MMERNVPRLRFPGFEGEWKKQPIKELISLSSSKYNPEREHADVKSIELEHLSSGSGELLGYNEGEKLGSLKNRFERDDILFGKLRPYLRKFLKAPFNGVCSSEIWVLKGKIVTNDFLFAMVQTETFMDLVNVSSGSKMPRSDWKVVSSGSFNVPETQEQDKISEFFLALSDKLNLLKKKKFLLEQYKKGMMQKIFNKELRFKDDDGKEFSEWEDILGGELFESISNKAHNSDLPILAITQEHGAIPRDQIDFNITVSDKSVDGYKVVEKGDFIISLRSFQGGIEYSNYKGICSPAYIILRLKRDYDSRYFKYYLKTETYIQLLNSNLEGIRDGKMISYKYFSEYAISCPKSVKEQTKIADFLSAIDDKINLVSQQIEKCEVWKKGLLGEMFV